MSGFVYGSKGQQFQQDPTTSELQEIDSVHEHIHRGEHFHRCRLDTGVTVASPKRFLFIIPNTSKRIHFVFMIESGAGDIKVEFFENPTVTLNGTSLTPINHNRNSSKVSVLQVFVDPTITVDGDLLICLQSGTTTAGGKASGSVTHLDEFILRQNTIYQMKTTTLATVDVSSEFEWYEMDGPAT